MTRYLAGRLAAMVPVLFIVSVLVFLMIRLIPGDPVQVMLGESGASAETIARVRHQLGLDDPLPVQYARFIQQMVTGDVRSIRTQQPVVQQFLGLFPSTLQLALTALGLATVLGITLGILAAIHQHSWLDTASMVLAFLGVSIPNFWLSLILIYIFAVALGWLPATGGGGLNRLILPAVALAVQQTALIARLVRAHMVEVLQEDYIKTARAKGGQRLALSWNVSPGSAYYDELIQGQMRNAGVEVQLSRMTTAAVFQAIGQGTINMASIGWISSDPVILTNLFHSKNINGGYTWSKYKDPQLDELLDSGEKTIDEAKRADIYAQAQKLIMDKALCVPVFQPPYSIGAHSKYQGIKQDIRNYVWLYDTFVQG